MRRLLLIWLIGCGPALAAESDSTVASREPAAEEPAESRAPTDEPPPAPAPESVVVPGRSAAELIAEAGVSTFVEESDFEVAAIDGAAMERWFVQKPASVFLYAERPIAVAEPDVTVRGRCQRVRRWESIVLNELAVVLWRRGHLRTVLHLGQGSVSTTDQERERGEWETVAVRTLPVGAVAWDDVHVRYAEGAALYEVACVPALRTVSCGGEGLLGPRAHCVDRELVVRPWRAPEVPHVGDVIPAYADPIPEVPEGDCEVQCEPSACAEAVRTVSFPRVPLYVEEAPVVAAFRTQAACRAFASSQETREAPDGGVW